MLYQPMSTAVGTNMTKNGTTPDECPEANANGAAAASTTAINAIMLRRNQSVLDAASGRERMMSHDPIASASQRAK
jgi:hypothetical protein